jgi:hypothetical protein
MIGLSTVIICTLVMNGTNIYVAVLGVF